MDFLDSPESLLEHLHIIYPRIKAQTGDGTLGPENYKQLGLVLFTLIRLDPQFSATPFGREIQRFLKHHECDSGDYSDDFSDDDSDDELSERVDVLPAADLAASADAAFRKKKYADALAWLDQYRESPLPARHDLTDERTHVYIHAKAVLCLLALRQTDRAVEACQRLFRTRSILRPEVKFGKPHFKWAFHALCACLYARRDLVRCAAVALRCYQTFPAENGPFKAFAARCQGDDPNLAGALESLPKDFFTHPKYFDEMFAPAPPPAEARLRQVAKRDDAATLVKRAALCLNNEKTSHALDCLEKLSCLDTLGQGDRIMYKYCLWMTRVNSGAQINEAYAAVKELCKKHGKYIELYNGVAQIALKLNKYIEAEDALRAGLEKWSKSQCVGFQWPVELASKFPESDSEILEPMMRKQLGLIATLMIPEAKCRYEACAFAKEDERHGREVFANDKKAYYVVKCSEKCTVEFHQDCWKKIKDDRVSLTTGDCVTPDCEGQIVEINLHRDGEVKRYLKEPVVKPKPAKPNKAEQKKVKGKAAKASAAEKAEKKAAAEVKGEKPKNAANESFGGAKPKVTQQPVTTAAPKKTKLRDEAEKLRTTFQKSLEAKSSDNASSAHPNNLSLYMSTLEGDIYMDDSEYNAATAYQDSRTLTDDLRKNLVGYKGEYISEKKAKEKEQQVKMTKLGEELVKEKELSYYLFECVRKLTEETETMTKSLQTNRTIVEKLQTKIKQLEESKARDQVVIQQQRELVLELQNAEKRRKFEVEDQLQKFMAQQQSRASSSDEARRRHRAASGSEVTTDSDFAVEDDPAVVSAGEAASNGNNNLATSGSTTTVSSCSDAEYSRGSAQLEGMKDFLKTVYPNLDDEEIEQLVLEQDRKERGENGDLDHDEDDDSSSGSLGGTQFKISDVIRKK